MRLLHVVPTYLPATRYGGPIYSVHALCRAMAARGHDVRVFTTNVDGPGDSAVPLDRAVDLDGVQVRYFPSHRLRRLYWSPPMARALSQATSGCDVMHLHSVFLWPTWAAARAARAARTPYLLSPRGMLVRDLIQRKSRWVKSAWIRLIERRNLERAAAIHVTSDTEGAELQRLFGGLNRVVTIPNGVDVDASRLEGSASDDVEAVCARPRLILFLGRISWKKGLDRLLAAMAFVPGDVHLAVAGNDEENLLPSLRAQVDALGLSHRVTFVARVVTGADKRRLFEAAQVFVLPSYSENFGNTVLEAMAAGCPVVVTPEVGAAGIVRASGGGMVVAGEPEALGRTLGEMIGAPDRAATGARGRAYVVEHLAWGAVAAAMERAYLDALGESAAAPATGAVR